MPTACSNVCLEPSSTLRGTAEEVDAVDTVLLVVVVVVAVAASLHAHEVDWKGPGHVRDANAWVTATKQGSQYANVGIGPGKA